MRTYTLAIFLIGMIALVAAIPANKKEIIKPKCTITCDDTEKIICAKGDGYETAFINECVLKKSNCENQRNLKKVSDGLCPGKTSVRLS